MPLVDTSWYTSSVGWTAVTAWATGTVKAAGALVRQNAAPAVNSERVFVCIIAGTTHASTEPTWNLTRGATTTDNTVTWQEATGEAGLNGDLTNTTAWLTIKNTAVVKGQVIKRASLGSLQICTTAGTAGNGAEPAFSNTAGVTTSDNTVTWTSLGAPSNFGVLAAPFARCAAALASTWAQLGNIVYVADNHAEIQTSAITLTVPTGGIGTTIASFDHTLGAVPPTAVTAGASIAIGAANVGFTIAGNSYWEGITFQQGTSGNNNFLFSNGQGQLIILRNCNVKWGAGSTGGTLFGAQTSQSKTIWDGVVYTTTNSNHLIKVEGDFTWRNTPSALVLTTPPSTLFEITTGRGSNIFLEGVDLSNFTGVIMDNVGAVTGRVVLKNCGINASATVAQVPSAAAYVSTDSVSVDSSTGVYKVGRIRYEGTLSTETTIVRTGGATDGTTTIAWKFVTSANSSIINPLESIPIRIWNNTSGALVNVTMYGIWGGGAVPNNNQIWFEAEYLNSASIPTVNKVTTGLATILSTAAACPTDTSTWGGSTTPFKMTTSFTPLLRGYLTIYVKAATLSTTFYVDPKPVLS